MSVIRIIEFDLWHARYGGATCAIYIAGTTTLASVYLDEALSELADNPQTLASNTVNGVAYGKFAAPLYTAQAYYLDIDSTDQTGIHRPPLTTIAGENASTCTAIATGGSAARTLAARFADRIHAADYGAIGGSADTNTDTLTAAIGAAAAVGGGLVLLPAGTIVINAITLSAGVVLAGHGRGATVIQSQAAADVVTLGGDRAGMAMLTLDGVNLVAGSVGVKSIGCDKTSFDDVEIKRFVTGLHVKGGRRARWRDLYITDCTSGAKLHGDVNDGTANGDEFRDNRWDGGRVIQCSTVGVEMSYEDRFVRHNTIADVGFEDNTGTAIKINGARYTGLKGCWWTGNTNNLDVLDDDNTANAGENTVIGVLVSGGAMSGGTNAFTKTIQDVIIEAVSLVDVRPDHRGNRHQGMGHHS